MIRSTEDFGILEGKSPVYIYGAKNIAERIYPILKDKGYDVRGFLVTNPGTNPQVLFGLPVIHILNFTEAENAYVVVASKPEYRREIVNSLLNRGVYHIVMLHDTYVNMLQTQLSQTVVDFFKDVSYTPYYFEEVESNHCVICNLDNPQRFKARIPSDWWFGPFMKIDKNLLIGNRLADKYESSWGKFSEVGRAVGTPETDVAVQEKCNFFSVRCHVDREIDMSEIPSYMTQIQAGAALTNKKICEITDNTGDNISERNKDFSECSAFYWIWKNQEKKEYTAVCHYRRHLAISSAALLEEFEKGTDLINTIPTVMYPSVGEFFDTNFFFEKDRELMLEAIAKLFPKYVVDEYKMSKDQFYLANNIFVMKTEWFDRMCEFVFGIILYIDDYYREKGFVRQDRYAGYVFEYLYALFVMHNAEDLEISYSNMKFLQ